MEFKDISVGNLFEFRNTDRDSTLWLKWQVVKVLPNGRLSLIFIGYNKVTEFKPWKIGAEYILDEVTFKRHVAQGHVRKADKELVVIEILKQVDPL